MPKWAGRGQDRAGHRGLPLGWLQGMQPLVGASESWVGLGDGKGPIHTL